MELGFDHVSLGPDGPRVAPLGVGTWQWGDRLLWGYGRGYTERDLAGAFETALQHGVTLFDTAEVYSLGRSERLLGQLARVSGAQVVTATKFMPYPWRLGRGDLRRALQGSLRRLGMPRVDLYQIHWPTPVIAVETWMHALADVAEAGLASALGVSNYSAEHTRRAHVALARHGFALASNQVEYSLLERQIERNDVLATCRRLGVQVIAYSPLGMGLLSGKYTPERPPSGWRGRLYRRKGPARVQKLVGLAREIGERHGGKTSSQVALNWLICKGALPIPGAKNAQQARENCGALGWRLGQEEVAALDAASEL